MATYIRKLSLFFLSEKCYDEFFLKLNFLDVECIKFVLSKALGTGIIIGSTLVKVPQILKILQAESSEGISFIAVLLELLGLTSNAAYNYAKGFPFSSWGESIFLVIETAAICFLVLYYSGRVRRACIFLILYSCLLYLLMGGVTPVSVLWGLQAANLPVAVTGKMLQAAKNLRNGHTGQLSAITIFMLFLGSCARIFTSIQETGDRLIIFTFIVASLANFILAAQVVYYWHSTLNFLAKKRKQKSE